jgi:hypothetical protein
MLADDQPCQRGVAHRPTTEQMLKFRALPAEAKLRWLEDMRQFVARHLPRERREILQRFRRGEI